MIGPTEQLVSERPGVIDNRCSGHEPGIVKWQRRFGEGDEPAIEIGERGGHDA
jgi:hypothetical protein